MRCAFNKATRVLANPLKVRVKVACKFVANFKASSELFFFVCKTLKDQFPYFFRVVKIHLEQYEGLSEETNVSPAALFLDYIYIVNAFE